MRNYSAQKLTTLSFSIGIEAISLFHQLPRIAQGRFSSSKILDQAPGGPLIYARLMVSRSCWLLGLGGS
jgi:hypothetical protein